jgi:hypothetical protein
VRLRPQRLNNFAEQFLFQASRELDNFTGELDEDASAGIFQTQRTAEKANNHAKWHSEMALWLPH